MSERPLLLALRALGLGDLLVTVPALRGLAAAFPEHRLVVAAPGGLSPLARVVGVDLHDVGPARPLPSGLVGPDWDEVARRLAGLGGVDVAVNLHGRGPESTRVLLATRPRVLLAHRHPDVPETAGGPEWRTDRPERERWCDLLRHDGVAADPGDVRAPAPPLPARWSGAAGAVLVHPGTALPEKRWPVERFAAVAAALARRGERVLVTGSAPERPLADAVAREAGLPPEAVLAGETDLADLLAVVAHAGLVVCGDTGVAHLATAFGVRSVVLFGSGAGGWGPPVGSGRHVVVEGVVAGAGPLPPGAPADPDATARGMASLTVERVLAAVDRATAA